MVKKSFKLTYKQEGSGSQSVVMDITPELTFGWLAQLADTEFGISENKQKFKMGFPPKILKMEPNEPLMVSAIKNDAFYSYLACSESYMPVYSRNMSTVLNCGGVCEIIPSIRLLLVIIDSQYPSANTYVLFILTIKTRLMCI